VASKRRSYTRGAPVRDYRKLYIIATEGTETEPAYFSMFQSQNATLRVHVLDSKHDSAPLKVFKRAEQYIQKQQLRKNDAVWLVLDRDNWSVDVLNTVWGRCRKMRFNLAVSNPCFEYWLLLHFENGSGVTSASNCRTKLELHLPNFAKGHVEIEKLRPRIQAAIEHAEQKDVPPCADWPHTNGTTVYRLVNELL
jgi:hypothetical protein